MQHLNKLNFPMKLDLGEYMVSFTIKLNTHDDWMHQRRMLFQSRGGWTGFTWTVGLYKYANYVYSVFWEQRV